MAVHAVREIANSAGFSLKASFSPTAAPDITNVKMHVGAVQESKKALNMTSQIRESVGQSLGNNAGATATSANASWADALKQNVASGIVAAGFTAVGMAPIGIAITAASTLSTMGKAATSFKEYDPKGDEIDTESYQSYADAHVSASSSPTPSPNTNMPQAIPQNALNVAMDDVVNRMGEDEVLDQMTHVSLEEKELMGQFAHHQEHLATISKMQVQGPMLG